MAFLTRIFSFLKRYLFKHPVYMLTYIALYFLPGFKCSIHFLSKDELISELLKGKSLIRMGDGDMVSIPLDIQHTAGRPDAIIKEWYKKIIQEYSPKSPYILSVPRFVTMTNTELDALGPKKLHAWLPVKVMFLLNFKKGLPYMDAHNFYYDNYFDSVVRHVFKDKKIILVANKVMADKQRANTQLPWKDIAYVEAPPHNAIDAYNEIVSNIDYELSKHEKKDVVLFVAIGPVAKHLVHEYSHKGYQSVDVGKVAEVMFTGESIEWII